MILYHVNLRILGSNLKKSDQVRRVQLLCLFDALIGAESLIYNKKERDNEKLNVWPSV